jgi:Carboxypeptidase regulatory-like domain
MCRRHVAATAAACPFCGAHAIARTRPLPSTVGRLTRAAVFAGAAGCATAPVYKAPPPPPPIEYPVTTPPAPAPGLATVSGVVRQEGARRANVPVYLHSENGRRETRSNDKGEFVFADLAPGRYSIVADPGYRNHRPQDGLVSQMPVDVVLAPDANERHDLAVVGPAPYEPDRGPCCKPYGAPPARRRVV